MPPVVGSRCIPSSVHFPDGLRKGRFWQLALGPASPSKSAASDQNDSNDFDGTNDDEEVISTQGESTAQLVPLLTAIGGFADDVLIACSDQQNEAVLAEDRPSVSVQKAGAKAEHNRTSSKLSATQGRNANQRPLLSHHHHHQQQQQQQHQQQQSSFPSSSSSSASCRLVSSIDVLRRCRELTTVSQTATSALLFVRTTDGIRALVSIDVSLDVDPRSASCRIIGNSQMNETQGSPSSSSLPAPAARSSLSQGSQQGKQQQQLDLPEQQKKKQEQQEHHRFVLDNVSFALTSHLWDMRSVAVARAEDSATLYLHGGAGDASIAHLTSPTTRRGGDGMVQPNTTFSIESNVPPAMMGQAQARVPSRGSQSTSVNGEPSFDPSPSDSRTPLSPVLVSSASGREKEHAGSDVYVKMTPTPDTNLGVEIETEKAKEPLSEFFILSSVPQSRATYGLSAETLQPYIECYRKEAEIQDLKRQEELNQQREHQRLLGSTASAAMSATSATSASGRGDIVSPRSVQEDDHHHSPMLSGRTAASGVSMSSQRVFFSPSDHGLFSDGAGAGGGGGGGGPGRHARRKSSVLKTSFMFRFGEHATLLSHKAEPSPTTLAPASAQQSGRFGGNAPGRNDTSEPSLPAGKAAHSGTLLPAVFSGQQFQQPATRINASSKMDHTMSLNDTIGGASSSQRKRNVGGPFRSLGYKSQQRAGSPRSSPRSKSPRGQTLAQRVTSATEEYFFDPERFSADTFSHLDLTTDASVDVYPRALIETILLHSKSAISADFAQFQAQLLERTEALFTEKVEEESSRVEAMKNELSTKNSTHGGSRPQSHQASHKSDRLRHETSGGHSTSATYSQRFSADGLPPPATTATNTAAGGAGGGLKKGNRGRSSPPQVRSLATPPPDARDYLSRPHSHENDGSRRRSVSNVMGLRGDVSPGARTDFEQSQQWNQSRLSQISYYGEEMKRRPATPQRAIAGGLLRRPASGKLARSPGILLSNGQRRPMSALGHALPNGGGARGTSPNRREPFESYTDYLIRMHEESLQRQHDDVVDYQVEAARQSRAAGKPMTDAGSQRALLLLQKREEEESHVRMQERMLAKDFMHFIDQLYISLETEMMAILQFYLDGLVMNIIQGAVRTPPRRSGKEYGQLYAVDLEKGSVSIVRHRGPPDAPRAAGHTMVWCQSGLAILDRTFDDVISTTTAASSDPKAPGHGHPVSHDNDMTRPPQRGTSLRQPDPTKPSAGHHSRNRSSNKGSFSMLAMYSFTTGRWRKQRVSGDPPSHRLTRSVFTPTTTPTAAVGPGAWPSSSPAQSFSRSGQPSGAVVSESNSNASPSSFRTVSVEDPGVNARGGRNVVVGALSSCASVRSSETHLSKMGRSHDYSRGGVALGENGQGPMSTSLHDIRGGWVAADEWVIGVSTLGFLVCFHKTFLTWAIAPMMAPAKSSPVSQDGATDQQPQTGNLLTVSALQRCLGLSVQIHSSPSSGPGGIGRAGSKAQGGGSAVSAAGHSNNPLGAEKPHLISVAPLSNGRSATTQFGGLQGRPLDASLVAISATSSSAPATHQAQSKTSHSQATPATNSDVGVDTDSGDDRSIKSNTDRRAKRANEKQGQRTDSGCGVALYSLSSLMARASRDVLTVAKALTSGDLDQPSLRSTDVLVASLPGTHEHHQHQQRGDDGARSMLGKSARMAKTKSRKTTDDSEGGEEGHTVNERKGRSPKRRDAKTKHRADANRPASALHGFASGGGEVALVDFGIGVGIGRTESPQDPKRRDNGMESDGRPGSASPSAMSRSNSPSMRSESAKSGKSRSPSSRPPSSSPSVRRDVVKLRSISPGVSAGGGVPTGPGANMILATSVPCPSSAFGRRVFSGPLQELDTETLFDASARASAKMRPATSPQNRSPDNRQRNQNAQNSALNRPGSSGSHEAGGSVLLGRLPPRKAASAGPQRPRAIVLSEEHERADRVGEEERAGEEDHIDRPSRSSDVDNAHRRRSGGSAARRHRRTIQGKPEEYESQGPDALDADSNRHAVHHTRGDNDSSGRGCEHDSQNRECQSQGSQGQRVASATSSRGSSASAGGDSGHRILSEQRQQRADEEATTAAATARSASVYDEEGGSTMGASRSRRRTTAPSTSDGCHVVKPLRGQSADEHSSHQEETELLSKSDDDDTSIDLHGERNGGRRNGDEEIIGGEEEEEEEEEDDDSDSDENAAAMAMSRQGQFQRRGGRPVSADAEAGLVGRLYYRYDDERVALNNLRVAEMKAKILPRGGFGGKYEQPPVEPMETCDARPLTAQEEKVLSRLYNEEEWARNDMKRGGKLFDGLAELISSRPKSKQTKRRERERGGKDLYAPQPGRRPQQTDSVWGRRLLAAGKSIGAGSSAGTKTQGSKNRGDKNGNENDEDEDDDNERDPFTGVTASEARFAEKFYTRQVQRRDMRKARDARALEKRYEELTPKKKSATGGRRVLELADSHVEERRRQRFLDRQIAAQEKARADHEKEIFVNRQKHGEDDGDIDPAEKRRRAQARLLRLHKDQPGRKAVAARLDVLYPPPIAADEEE